MGKIQLFNVSLITYNPIGPLDDVVQKVICNYSSRLNLKALCNFSIEDRPFQVEDVA